MSIYLDTRCCDCHYETNHHVREDDDAEWYMVHKEIWTLATRDKPANFLCIGCLEKRIGRILSPTDFSDVPLNWIPEYPRSPRLRSRMMV